MKLEVGTGDWAPEPTAEPTPEAPPTAEVPQQAQECPRAVWDYVLGKPVLEGDASAKALTAYASSPKLGDQSGMYCIFNTAQWAEHRHNLLLISGGS